MYAFSIGYLKEMDTWINHGHAKVSVTSFIFDEGII